MKKKEINSNRKMIIAGIVIIIMIVVIFARLNSKSSKEDMEKLVNRLIDKEIAPNGVITQSGVADLQKMDYEDIKSSLKPGSDFCFYIQDEKGDIIVRKGSEELTNQVCK